MTIPSSEQRFEPSTADTALADAVRSQHAAILDQASDAILVLDLQRRITLWNRSAQKLYGWSAAEALGQDAVQLLHRSGDSCAGDALKTLQERAEWTGEMTQLTKDGREVLVLSRWTGIRDEYNQAQAYLLSNTDITEKRKRQTLHLRAQRMESLGILAGGIAHDLNNVLTPILMAIDLLKINCSNEDSLAVLRALETSAEKGAQMVKQVLSFARGKEGKRAPLHLKHAWKEAEMLLRHALPKSICLESSIPNDTWCVVADSTQMVQIIMNLCINARDAMPQGGRLTITARNQILDEQFTSMHPGAHPGLHVVIDVQDTGSGIPSAIIDRIFEPFFTTKEQGKGTGLGLSTVSGIVASHNGFIDVRSAVGKGTQFSVYLPAGDTGSAKTFNQQQEPLLRGQGEVILVVDDEGPICDVTKATLQAYGYRVLTAGDGAEAMATFVENRETIRLVLTDMIMPVMDGPATIRAMRKLAPRLPIVATTGLRSNGTGQAELAGAQGILRKPYTAEKLLRVLRQLLDQDDEAESVMTTEESAAYQPEA